MPNGWDIVRNYFARFFAWEGRESLSVGSTKLGEFPAIVGFRKETTTEWTDGACISDRWHRGIMVVLRFYVGLVREMDTFGNWELVKNATRVNRTRRCLYGRETCCSQRFGWCLLNCRFVDASMNPLSHPVGRNNHSFNRGDNMLAAIWVLEVPDHHQILEKEHTMQQTCKYPNDKIFQQTFDRFIMIENREKKEKQHFRNVELGTEATMKREIHKNRNAGGHLHHVGQGNDQAGMQLKSREEELDGGKDVDHR